MSWAASSYRPELPPPDDKGEVDVADSEGDWPVAALWGVKRCIVSCVKMGCVWLGPSGS